ncbi:sigma factor [Nocardia sp. CA-119907]|uniref:sigma factor n=1 Tax=Nocardia sp. CA-119907 TaxID=3239973 RepID=UPI003D962D9A
MAAGAVEIFERQRARLLGLAYETLGSAADAEDIVQETFLRWHNTEPGSVEVPWAWLAKVAMNLCPNRLDSVRSRRERYLGTWLPEPVLPPDSALGRWRPSSNATRCRLCSLCLPGGSPGANERCSWRHSATAIVRWPG